jgi:hypothetical protein
MIASSQSKLEYFNSYGLIFDDCFYVNRENDLSCIRLNRVKKVKMVKGRKITINVVAFLVSCAIVYFSLLLQNDQMIFKYLFYVGAASFLITSLFFKKYCYNIIVITIDYQPISINVELKSKNQAKTIVSKVNKKIANREVPLMVG